MRLLTYNLPRAARECDLDPFIKLRLFKNVGGWKYNFQKTNLLNGIYTFFFFLST